MKAVTRFIRDTLVGGILFLVPIIVLLAILGRAHKLASRIVGPLAARIPYESIIGLSTPKFFAIVLLVLFCFLTGLFARTALARRMVNALEESILSKLPGYTIMKGMIESIAGVDQGARQVVLISIEDEAWQIAFLMERIEPDQVAVFVPGTPDPRSGSVYYVAADRVRVLDLPMMSALDCIKNAGKGSNKVLKGKL